MPLMSFGAEGEKEPKALKIPHDTFVFLTVIKYSISMH